MERQKALLTPILLLSNSAINFDLCQLADDGSSSISLTDD